MGHESNLMRLAATILFASIWQSLALTACTEIFLRLAPSISAKVRFQLWTATFFICCLLPLIELTQRVSMPTSLSSSVANGATGGISISMRFGSDCLIIWGIATTVSVVRLVSGLWAVHQLIGTSVPASATLINLRTCVSGPSASFAQLLVSDRIAAPIAAGFINAAIILPARFVESLPQQHLAALLQHESQHLVRRDAWTTLTVRVLRALFPLNPGLWYIDHRLAIAREIACDDGVLAAGVPPQNYADCLAQAAELAFHHRSHPLVSGFLGQQSQIFIRVDRVLSPRKASPPAFAFSTCTAGTLIVLSAFLLGVPDLVNLSAPTPVQSSDSGKSSPKPSDDWFDYLASPSVYPSAPSIRPPSMPVLRFPKRVRHTAATNNLRKTTEG